MSLSEWYYQPFLQSFAKYDIQEVKRFIGAGAMSVLLIDLSIFSSDTTTVILLLRDQFGSAEFPLHVWLLLKSKIILIFKNRSFTNYSTWILW